MLKLEFRYSIVYLNFNAGNVMLSLSKHPPTNVGRHAPETLRQAQGDTKCKIYL